MLQWLLLHSRTEKGGLLPQERRYISRNARQLRAESTGRVLSAFLELYFRQYVDYDFTADMEAKLDGISGKLCVQIAMHHCR